MIETAADAVNQHLRPEPCSTCGWTYKTMPEQQPDGANVPAGHRTWHLTPAAIWYQQSGSTWYEPERFEAEGFIHCTDDRSELMAVGNRYYRQDPRPFVALLIACDELGSRIIYEDSGRMFPHIYGRLERDAVLAVMNVVRGTGGEFLSIDKSTA